MSYIFGGNTGMTYADLVRARERQREMQARAASLMPEEVPNTFAGGLAALGSGLIARNLRKKEAELGKQNDALDGRLKGQYRSAFNELLSGGGTARPTRNEAMAANGGPTVAAAETWGGNAASGGGSVDYTPGDKDSFIQAMMPHALRVSQETGLDPRLVIAQAAQETGWGKSAPNNNFFGIKSHGKPGGANLSTREVIDGNSVTINDNFRQYGGMGQSADDYARFLRENPRYRDMLSAPDLDGQLAALGASGYATDPNYSHSVGSIARGIALPTGGQPSQAAGNATSTRMPSNNQVASNATLPQILELMKSPYASDSEKAVLAQMADRIINPPQPKERKIIKGADGFNYYQDTQERVLPNVQVQPEYRQVRGSEVGLTGELADMTFNVGRDGKATPIGGAKTVIENNMPGADKFAEAFASGDAKALAAISESGIAAQRNLGRIEQLESLLDASDSGFGANAKLIAGDFGIKTEGLDDVQAARALINSLVPEQRQPGSGPMSDADLALFKESLPRIINQPGSNQTIINTMRGIAQYDAEGASIVQSLRAGELSRAQAFQALQNRANPLEGFKSPQASSASPQASQSEGAGVEPWMINTDPASWTEEQKRQAERAWGLR